MAQYKEFIAKIEARTDGEWKTKGTGYPVSRNMLLTAKHVLKQFDPSDVRICFNFLKQPVTCIAKDLHRFEDCEYDFALIEFESETPIIAPGIITASKQEDDQRWSSRGYPLAGEIADKSGQTTETAIELKGSFYSKTDAEFFQVLEEDAACTALLWKGLSGAPIFVGNAAITGIIINTNSNFKGQRLQALNAQAMLSNERFRTLCGTDAKKNSELEKRILSITNKVNRCLKSANKSLLQSLAEELKKKGYPLLTQTPSDLFDCLCTEVPHHVAIGAVNTACRVAREESNAADVEKSFELLDVLTPALLGAAGAKQLSQAGDGLSVIKLDVPDAMVLEACMACHDGRNADYVYLEKGEDFFGALLVQNAPDGGIYDCGFSFDVILTELLVLLGLDVVISGGKSGGKELLKNYTKAELVDEISNLLEDEQVSILPRTRYLIVPEIAGAEEVADEINRCFQGRLPCLRASHGLGGLGYARLKKPFTELQKNRSELVK